MAIVIYSFSGLYKKTHIQSIYTMLLEENSTMVKFNNRNRKLIWFNPLFCKLTNINIGKYFLNLLDRHFNKDNPLSKIFNRNNIKISNSCTSNMYEILNNHNRRLLD